MPALRRSQDNDAKAKKESVVERTSRAAMVKVTELRRKERRQKQTKPIAKTTPTDETDCKDHSSYDIEAYCIPSECRRNGV